MPANFAAAKSNLKDVPKIYTEIALQQMPGIIKFFQNDVPLAFKSVTDAKLLAEFKASNDKVISELQSYQDFLKNDLLPISNGDFRIGAENYRKKLQYEQMVDIPLDRLLQIGYDDLHKNQAELKRVAAQIDPSKTPEQILEQLEQDHPQADQLLQSFRDTFNGLVEFIQQKHIITLPSQVRPIVEETPPFSRALSTASMDTPGPYEDKATEAYFNVTLARGLVAAAKDKAVDGKFQSQLHCERCRPRGLSRTLHAVSVGEAGAVKGAQADRLRLKLGGLGTLCRADDAG